MGSLGACSTQTTDLVSCADNTECRDLFGLGSVCASDGFCDATEVHPRCTETYPENLLTDPELAKTHIIFGSVEERGEDIFRSFERAARLAFLQANARGGVDGRNLGIVLCNIDDGSSGGPNDGLSTSEALTETGRYLALTLGVPAIIGPAKSGDAEALFQELNPSSDPSGVLMISPSATSDQLEALDPTPSNETPGLFWRTAPPDSLQGNAIAVDMRTLNVEMGRDAIVTKAVAIYQDGAYGDNLSRVFASAFMAAGGPLPQTRPFTSDSERDAAVTAVGDDPTIDEVLFISSNTADTIAFFNAAAIDIGYDTKTIFVPDAAATSDVLGVADPARFGNTRGSRPAPLKRNEDLVYAAFLAAYENEYPDETDVEQLSFTANAYDAAWLLGYGTAWAIGNEGGVITGQTIARGLRRVSSGELLQVGPGDWTAALQAFSSGQSFDIEGASGDLDYDPINEETTAPTEIWSVAGTSIVGLYTIPAP